MSTKHHFLLLYAFSLLTAYSTLTWNLPPETHIPNLVQLVRKINLERKIDAILIMNALNTRKCCLSDEDIKILSTNRTVRLLQAETNCSHSFADLNEDMLFIRCVSENFAPEQLDQMVVCLENRRNVRMMFIWSSEYTEVTSPQRAELMQEQEKLFTYCASKRLLNVIGIYRDFLRDGHYYTYSYFPHFQLQRKTLAEDCFPDRVKDVKGLAIRTVPDQLEPWSLVWREDNGTVNVIGFLKKFLQEYAKRINGSISYPLPVEPENVPDMSTLISLLKNDTLDIVMSSTTGRTYDVDVTAVISLVDLTIMLPIPGQMMESELLPYLFNSLLGLAALILLFVFAFLLTAEFFLLQGYTATEILCSYSEILLNVVLRNLLGQASCTRVSVSSKLGKRLLFMALLFTGILMSTLINASLNSYLTNPISYPRLKTFEDLINSGLTVKTSPDTYSTLDNYFTADNINKSKSVFSPATSSKDLNLQRNSFDRRYGYTLLSSLWDILERYQTFLPEPLFYVSEEIFIVKRQPMAFPMQKYSIFKESLDLMIDNLQSAGIVIFWSKQTYEDMIVAKKLNATHQWRKMRRGYLGFEDLYWLWFFYIFGVGISMLVFLTEMWFYSRTKQNGKVKCSIKNFNLRKVKRKK
ncbi:uncharacterized protein LOC101460053 [Ceratitis capitata]|uniref:uncharacterized protein LOC101460053 n=1 Tax=Ceratitis capitata TaxID=7213 RepID=UPI0006187F84|nr:uncharacterized protein LOC101460053 [Ceratitis capitata]